MNERRLSQMKALIAQAVAEAHHDHQNPRVTEVQLIAYGIDVEQVEDLFVQASQGTLTEGAQVVVQQVGTRYICWNCCGLRFASLNGHCPNCGETALEIPEEIVFALRGVKAVEAETQ